MTSQLGTKVTKCRTHPLAFAFAALADRQLHLKFNINVVPWDIRFFSRQEVELSRKLHVTSVKGSDT